MTKTEAKRCKWVREMMADIMGDVEWLTVATDEGVFGWINLGPSWEPTTSTTRELCELLIEQSVAPEHCAR
jgi:hypothetical protein